MEGFFLRLLLVLLSIQQLILLNAVPITGTRNLVMENTHLQMANPEESSMEERVGRRRDVEVNDYPPIGPDPRHTPPPPSKHH
ncbi:hypothetical protein NMG60_11034655 [Bertholletia excelsa]